MSIKIKESHKAYCDYEIAKASKPARILHDAREAME